MKRDLVVETEAGLDKAVEVLLQFAEGRKKIALTGELGAGKTTFVRAFCCWLKVVDNVSSPTFSIVNEYVFLDKNGLEQSLHHLDLYRLRDLDEAFNIGIDEYLYDPYYCLIEWPKIFTDLLPDDMVFVEIRVQSNGSRHFIFSNDKNSIA